MSWREQHNDESLPASAFWSPTPLGPVFVGTPGWKLQRTSSSRPAKSGRLTVTGASAAGSPPPFGGAFSLVGAALHAEIATIECKTWRECLSANEHSCCCCCYPLQCAGAQMHMQQQL